MTATPEVGPTAGEQAPVGSTRGLLVPASARSLRATAAAAYLGVLLSLVLIAIGGVGIRDGVRAAGWITGTSWTGATVDWIDGLKFAAWMPFAGSAAVLVGIVFVGLAVKPRRKTALEVSGRSSVVIPLSDLARAAASAAKAVPGVVDARATTTRKKMTVHAKTTAGGDGDAAVTAAVTSAVGVVTEMLSSPPRIVVRTRAVGGLT